MRKLLFKIITIEGKIRRGEIDNILRLLDAYLK
jgi:hypothetical protein